MSVANTDDGRAPIRVTWVRGERAGQTETLPYREAVGMLSLARAVVAEKPKKSSVSPAARKGQDGAKAGKKPPTGDSDSGGR